MNVSTCIHLAVLLSCLVAVCGGRGVRYFPYGIDGVVVIWTVHRLGGFTIMHIWCSERV